MTITNTFVRNYPFGDLACAHPRLRRRDLAGPAEVEQGLRARRQGRPGRDRVLVRQGAPRAAGPGASCASTRSGGRSARSSCGRRPLPATRSGSRSTRSSSAPRSRRSSAGSTSRRPTTSGTRRPARSSPSTRSDGAIRALASYPTFDPNALHEPQEGRARAAARSERGQGGQLSGARPRDRGRISTGLDVQAGDGAGRDAGAHPVAVQRAALHGHVQGRGSDSSRTGTRS